MRLKNRLIAIAVIILLAVLTVIFAQIGTSLEAAGSREETAEDSGFFKRNQKETIFIWYTDQALTAYLTSAAVAYSENRNIRVIPILESGLEYLENINQASLNGECPDLYILGHDSLEKAYLAGLAAEIKIQDRVLPDELYPAAALNAVSYHGKKLAYPFYFETSSLLYNKTYLTQLSQETGAAVEEMLPNTIEDIRTFADTYDAPEQVEAVFKWDVSDIFYNYFFVGNAITVGGEAGDDTGNIDIYNLNAINSMKMYQELNQFFAIDTKDVEYSEILDDFIAGKIVFTIATTDAIARLEHAIEDGLFPYEYGIAFTPDINADTHTRSLSMTSCVVVNGYGEHQAAANDFALFLTTEYAKNLFARSEKVACASGVDYGYENLNWFAEEYRTSVPMPKMIETSNFWVQLEVVFSRIWDGANVNDQLKGLSEQIMTQIHGEPYTEERILEPEENQEEVEYLDEDLYRQEAMTEGQ